MCCSSGSTGTVPLAPCRLRDVVVEKELTGRTIVRGGRKARKSSQRSRTRVKFLQGQIFSPVLHFPTIRAASSGPLRDLARVKFFFQYRDTVPFCMGSNFFERSHSSPVRNFWGSCFHSTFLEATQLRHKFLKNCTKIAARRLPAPAPGGSVHTPRMLELNFNLCPSTR